MIDHIGIKVSDYAKSREFYRQALAPLGYTLLVEVEGFAGFGRAGEDGPIATFWLHQGEVIKGHTHIAFRATSRELVVKFYQAAISAGGKDNGEPGIREQYHSNYYAAFVLDPDGYNVEAVCHKPESFS